MLEGAKLIGAGAATIALAGAAIGIGNVNSSLIHSVSRMIKVSYVRFVFLLLDLVYIPYYILATRSNMT